MLIQSGTERHQGILKLKFCTVGVRSVQTVIFANLVIIDGFGVKINYLVHKER